MMSAKPRTTSPFTTADRYCTSLALCSSVKQFYKVPDAEKWYKENRQRISDKAIADQFGFLKFETIHEWHENKMRLMETPNIQVKRLRAFAESDLNVGLGSHH